ncbi:MAG: hypothetical protein MZV63_43420 [Marinilabiliales bacterium]|nr:hypothetical protein [Marinilabiliales bacterium]
MTESYDDVMLPLSGGFAEIIYAPKGDMSKWYMAGLVNLVNSQIDELDYQSATLHLGYLLQHAMCSARGRGNLRLFRITPYAKASLGIRLCILTY